MSARLTLLLHPNMASFLNHVVEMFDDGLNSLGIETLVTNEPRPDFADRAIVFGANFFTEPQLLPLLARNSVIFNVENVESQPLNPVYRYHLAYGYWKTGSAAHAREELQRALASNTAFAGREDAERMLSELNAASDHASR